jgi:hypothetical protein
MAEDQALKFPDGLTESEIRARLTATIEAVMTPYYERLTRSQQRVVRLLTTFEGIHKTDDDSSADDLLRAIVVFNHAFLEDFLRTLALSMLPYGDERALDRIPLAGTGGRPEKFLLGKLAGHKGKAVDDVLRESVSEHLERSNFNSVGEIAILLETLGFDVSMHNKTFPEISIMMERRHQIVHRADEIQPPDSSGEHLRSIDVALVRSWINATHGFMIGLLAHIISRSARDSLEKMAGAAGKK